MGQRIRLKSSDGQELEAYKAVPAGAAKGGVVVLQEIFGINSHIRSMADRLAEQGYVAIAPALFDRVAPGTELSYEGDDFQRGIELMQKLDKADVLKDIKAAFDAILGEAGGANKTGIVGFCFGGLMSWLSATRGSALGLRPGACVAFYPGGIGSVATEQPSCPVQVHLGAADTHIGHEQGEAVKSAHPEVEVYFYEGAGHAFNRDVDPKSFHPEAAAQAWSRTLAFFGKHLA